MRTGGFPALGGRPLAAPPHFHAVESPFRSRLALEVSLVSIPNFSGIDFVESGLGAPKGSLEAAFGSFALKLAQRAVGLPWG